jgi:hypothetical protein
MIVKLYGNGGGVYFTPEGGDPLVCASCGGRVDLPDGVGFTTDGVLTLHALPECDPELGSVSQ